MPVVTDHTALLSGSYWNGIEVTGRPVIVTYSFPATAAAYMANVDGFTAATVASFAAFNSAQQDQARAALGEWAAASGLVFIEVAPGQGDVNFQLADFDTTSAPSYAGAGGLGLYPFGGWDFFTYPSFDSDLDAAGDVFMNSQLVSGGTVNYGTLLHEIGHAIGLKHPTEIVTDFAANPVVTHDQVLATDDPAQTIMAQTGEGAAQHLEALDLQAAAYLYGPAGTGGVVTGDASGANAVVSAWSWDSVAEILTQAGFAGDDTLRGSSVRDVIDGLGGDDRLFGLNGDDTLDGAAGNDLLDGGPGRDTMTGGTGDDTYRVDDPSDRVVERAGEGFDAVLARASWRLSADVELLQLFGAGLTGRGNDLGNTMFADASQGSELYGLAGNDYMVGGAGSDVLNGGAGDDAMFGGAGDDTYIVDGLGDSVREDGTAGVDDGGIDTVKSSVSVTLSAFVEHLTLTGEAAIDGTGNGLANVITGNAGANHLVGLAGNDVLNGRGGADLLDGGEGSDTYKVDGSDIVHDTGSQGLDKVVADGDYALAAGSGIERLTTAAGIVGGDLTGDEGANTIIGNAGANRLNGGAGRDTLQGDDGADVLIGGGGADLLLGGAGRDVMIGGAGRDTFRFAIGDSPLAGPGFDTVRDFATGVDRIDLGILNGAPAGPAYAEIAVASDSRTVLSRAAAAELAGGAQAVFVAGLSDGWLFWSSDGASGTADEAILLTGRNSLSGFAAGDLT
jgi:Ca2+-binding RTX toxin-like protein